MLGIERRGRRRPGVGKVERTNLLLSMAWIAAAVCAPAPADEAKDVSRARKDYRPRAVRKTGTRFRRDLTAWVKSMNLPKDQEKKLLANVKRWQARQEALEKAQADRAKQLARQWKPLQKQQEQLRKEMRELQAKQAKEAQRSGDRVAAKPLLSEGQLRDWESHRLYRSLLHQYRRARLTEDQQGKLRTLCDREAKKLASAGPGDRAKVDRQVRQHLSSGLDRLLTGSQREAMAAMAVEEETLSSMQGIRLTGEQHKKVQALCTESVRKLRLRSGKDLAASKQFAALRARKKGVAGDLVRDIRKKILTPEQRKQLQAADEAKAAKAGKGNEPAEKPAAKQPWWKKLFGG